MLKQVVASAVLASAASMASASLIDLRFTGTWTPTTIDNANYTFVGSTGAANSVFAGTGTVVDQWNTTNTTPSKVESYSSTASQVVPNPTAADYSFAREGTTLTRFNPVLNTTEGNLTPAKSWSYIARDRGVNIVAGLTSTGEVGRVYYSGGWVGESGSTIGNSSTGYTSLAVDGGYTAGLMFYSSGGGNGLDRTYYSGASWVKNDNLTTENYDLLSVGANQSNVVFGANADGLDVVYFSGSWINKNINSRQYIGLITDVDQTNVLYGLTSTGVDQIYSTDNGANWTTVQNIVTGNFGSIAENAGVKNAMYLTVVPEPASLSAIALAAGGLLMRRRRA